MKKINLKNILKRTFKNKKKSLNKNKKKGKASKKFKVTKVSKKNKKIKKTIKPKIKTSAKNEKVVNEANKTNNLRIPKANELKPEIKKIKKQETEKKEYKIKDYVVYPKHGVGQILSVNNKTVGGIDVQCYDIKFEKDKAIGLLPVNKQSHLRPLATINQVNKSMSILKTKPKIRRSMWSRRAQEYEQKITSGKIYELAEVVRDLNKGDGMLVDQSYSERQLFEKAYDRILSEFQIVMKLSLEDTQKKLNKILKRNLEAEIVKVENKTIQTTEVVE
ncbi:uncharacterized protein METZ01_LOCUS151923 [marine metagenome]|uniref:CarD-like/TRCF RNAP-interacting domain-containing protein n=1 Tax=marine metagenome TaxID=408172 RepID=A0A382ACE3_9ZZZZ